MLDEEVGAPTETATETQPKPETAPVEPPRASATGKRRIADITRAITFATFVVVFFAAVIGNWLRVQNVDPMYAYDIVLRTMHFGGTYYQNSINDWGPGEPYLYSVVAHVFSRDAFWYGISLVVAIFALITAAAAARTAQLFGAQRDVAVAAGVVVFVHLTLTNAPYAGQFYVRNLTTALLATAWLIALDDRTWKTRRRSMILAAVVGAVLGLAVQNLLSTVLTAGVLTIVFLAWARAKRPRTEYGAIDFAFVGGGAAGFLSAPIWYLLRGSFTEFWEGWWTYAHFMSVGTGTSLGTQFASGWDHFYIYYEQRPLIFLVVLGFVATAILDWPRASREDKLLYVGLLAWWAAAWIELIISQRYSPQYYMVIVVPMALIAAALAGRVWRAIVAARGHVGGTYAFPLIALALSIYLFGPATFVQSMRDLSNFTSVHDHAAAIASQEAGDQRTGRAVLDLVSKDWDPVLMWTNDPWPYLNYKRISATRFIWESFLTGSIYLGRTGPQYVLPHSWQWFQDDLKQSNPVAYMKSNGGDIPPNSPFAGYIAANMTQVYPDAMPISYRNDVAQQILTASAPNMWAATQPLRDGSGWKPKDGQAVFRDTGNRETDFLPATLQSCTVVQGDITSDGPAGGVVFWFFDNTGKAAPVNLDFDGDHVSAANANVEFHRLPSAITAGGTTPAHFRLIVGKRAAALVVNGQIRAAVDIPNSVSVRMASQRSNLKLSHLQTGAAPAATGC
jgi:hypothetical protein